MIADTILSVLKEVLPEKDACVALHEPNFEGKEWEYVKECIDTGWVSSVGKYVDRFEKMLSEYTGIKRVVAVVNGMAALHIALLIADVSEGDEVLVPTLTFVMTANVITFLGAIPHFIDSDEKTLGLDPIKLEEYLKDISVFRQEECFNRLTGRRIRAVVPVHTFGHPVDLDSLQEICSRFRIVMLEDAAESMGTLYKEKHTGNWGMVSAISFNGNKIITTGGGGAILTNDDDLGEKAKHITTTAKVPHKWKYFHDSIGYNYRMPNINAALGCAQLERIQVFLGKKRDLANRYEKAFMGVEGVSFFKEPGFAKSNYWLNVLLLDQKYKDQRDVLLELSNNTGIMLRPVWELMHKLPMYKNCPRMDLSTSEDLAARIINIPSSVFI